MDDVEPSEQSHVAYPRDDDRLRAEIAAEMRERRMDREFKARLDQRMIEDREILDRLADE